MSFENSFAGKRILITGGANGLGLALVKKFHDASAVVFTVDRDGRGLENLKKEFSNVTTAVVDLSDWDATRKVVESFGSMDYLVNNAGVFIYQPFLEITKEAVEKQMNVNYVAMINIGQVVAKGMIASKAGGAIVNVSSVGDRMGVAGMGCYCSTKAAITSITKTMAIELGAHGIRVNCVCPGGMDTDMLKQVPSSAEAVLDRSVIKRPVVPSEVADLVFFLLSPLAGMMTGTAYTIDGGLTAS